MTGWLPDEVTELFGADATAEESYDLLTVDVPAESWTTALLTARATLGCTYFDWLSAVDEPGTGFRICAHVVALHPVRRLLVRTTVPHTAPVLASAVEVYAGAAWHERETHEMFGVDFTGHPGLDPLLLPDSFEGHPLRKDFVLAARVAKAWPGAKEPGESDHGGPKRRQMLPPGVPDPNEWGPLKGQLPPAPARPARGARAAAAGDRPARRTRTAGAGSASQTAGQPAGAAESTPPRRTRSASEGSASQPSTAADSTAADSATLDSTSTGSTPAAGASGTAEATTGTASPAPRRARSASQGSASQQRQTPATGEAAPAETEPQGDGKTTAPSDSPAGTRSADAPWHHPRPAFTEEKPDAPGDASDQGTSDQGVAGKGPSDKGPSGTGGEADADEGGGGNKADADQATRNEAGTDEATRNEARADKATRKTATPDEEPDEEDDTPAGGDPA